MCDSFLALQPRINIGIALKLPALGLVARTGFIEVAVEESAPTRVDDHAAPSHAAHSNAT